MRYSRFCLLFIVLFMAACANAQPASTPYGKPVRCLTLSAIRNMTVVDKRTLLFEMPGHKYYVNPLPRACPRIDSGDPLMYQTRIDSLCNLDIVTVLIPIGGGFQMGPACGLGIFKPIGPDEAKKLQQKKH